MNFEGWSNAFETFYHDRLCQQPQGDEVPTFQFELIQSELQDMSAFLDSLVDKNDDYRRRCSKQVHQIHVRLLGALPIHCRDLAKTHSEQLILQDVQIHGFNFGPAAGASNAVSHELGLLVTVKLLIEKERQGLLSEKRGLFLKDQDVKLLDDIEQHTRALIERSEGRFLVEWVEYSFAWADDETGRQFRDRVASVAGLMHNDDAARIPTKEADRKEWAQTPIMLGFASSRQNEADAATLGPDNRLNYHHPDYLQNKSRYRQEYDYYSMGMMLLEIGHWAPLVKLTENANLQEILALAQSREVDFLPLIHQPTLGNVGAGLTAVVNQRFIRNDLELAFKEVNSGSAFLRELSFVSARALRAHPFITKLQGIGWSVDSRKEGNKWVIKPVLVFEKATHSTLWSFMHTREGGSLSYKQRISICIQLAIAVADLEDHRIIHGDIKPKNILVFVDGVENGAVTIQLADFGHSSAVPDEAPDLHLFELTLAAEPSARPTSIDTPLQILRDCFEACTKDDDPDPPCVTEKPLAVAPSMTYDAIRKIPDVLNWFDVVQGLLQLSDVDYRVRVMIFDSLIIRYQEVLHEPDMTRLRDAIALEIASCYWLGFGTKRDEALAKVWLAKHTPNQGFFDYRLTKLKNTLGSCYLWWTKLSQQLQIGHLDFTNDMQYYRDQQQTQAILEVERRELEDWEEVLGPGHFIVSSRSLAVCEKLINIGMQDEAIALTQSMYDRSEAVLPSDHVALNALRSSLVKLYLMEDRLTEARQYLFELHPELKDERSRVKLLEDVNDAVFLRDSANYILLAVLETGMKRYKKADTIYRLVIPRMCKLLGDRNLQCVRARYDWAMHHSYRGNYPKALELLDPLYKVTVSNYGETHELSLLVAQSRVEHQVRLRIYRKTWVGRFASRKFQMWFYKEPIEAAQAYLGNDHPYTIMAINRGVAALAGNLRYKEAIELAKCAVELVEKRSGKGSNAAEYQRGRLKLVQQSASLHGIFFTWGSWTLRSHEPWRFRGIPIWWKTTKFEPFKLDLTLDPNYRADNVTA
ncbi:hypothetical protein J4E81_006364 [Alternaria sp. BMP 2799]|nr:hypothetical protein J4E81_006364 [Alternaria sp. BMP 2799]